MRLGLIWGEPEQAPHCTCLLAYRKSVLVMGDTDTKVLWRVFSVKIRTLIHNFHEVGQKLYEVGQLVYEVGQLLDGVGQLVYEVGQLLDGVGQLVYEVGQLLDGVGQLLYGGR